MSFTRTTLQMSRSSQKTDGRHFAPCSSTPSLDDSLFSPTSLLGDAVETFLRHEDAERCVEEVRRDLSRRVR